MNEITATQRRTTAYWYVDGIAETVGGVALGLVGLFMYLSVTTGNDSWSTAALMAMIVGFPLTAQLVRQAKDRITHPRTGYVKYPEPSGRRRIVGLVVAMVVAAGVAFLAIRSGDTGFSGAFGTTLVAATGAAVSAAVFVRGWKMGMRRFYVTGLLLAVATIAVLANGYDYISGLGILWMVFGAASVVTGLIAFVAYLRDTAGVGDAS